MKKSYISSESIKLLDNDLSIGFDFDSQTDREWVICLGLDKEKKSPKTFDDFCNLEFSFFLDNKLEGTKNSNLYQIEDNYIKLLEHEYNNKKLVIYKDKIYQEATKEDILANPDLKYIQLENKVYIYEPGKFYLKKENEEYTIYLVKTNINSTLFQIYNNGNLVKEECVSDDISNKFQFNSFSGNLKFNITKSGKSITILCDNKNIKSYVIPNDILSNDDYYVYLFIDSLKNVAKQVNSLSLSF